MRAWLKLDWNPSKNNAWREALMLLIVAALILGLRWGWIAFKVAAAAEREVSIQESQVIRLHRDGKDFSITAAQQAQIVTQLEKSRFRFWYSRGRVLSAPPAGTYSFYFESEDGSWGAGFEVTPKGKLTVYAGKDRVACLSGGSKLYALLDQIITE